MRLTLWLILIFAFSVGMCSAIAVRTFYFEAVPVTAQNSEPTTKILVAKQTIPEGVEIAADSVIFQEVAVSEVPIGSLTSFDQVYRRKPAYPIPIGCPICEDLLVPSADTHTQTVFLPAGSQFVTLDVAHIRQGNKVLSPEEPLPGALAADQQIDIRVVPRDDAQGKFAEKKNEVLRTFAADDFRESGELLFENVPIHQVQKKAVAGQAVSPQVLLVLDKDEAAQLTAAAKKGQIRILMSNESEKTAPMPPMPEENDDVSENLMADSPVQESPALSPPIVPGPLDVPLDSELPSPMITESVPVEPVKSVPLEIAGKTVPTPKTPDIFESALPYVPSPDVAFSSSKEEAVPSTPVPLEKTVAPTVPELILKEKIRNDPPILAFGKPALRMISERAAEPKPVLTVLEPTKEKSLPGEWKQDSSLPPYSGTVAEYPRISRSLSFQAPGIVEFGKEYPKTTAQQTEVTLIPQETLSAPSISQMPSYSVPNIVQESIIQEKVPAYSPFERRGYTVPPNDISNEIYDVLPAPSLLQRNADADSE